LIACIGPKTAKAAAMAGYHVDIVPEHYTVEGLIDAMKDHFRRARDMEAACRT
jgi:uroporphyrinogen-III synthase